MTNNLDVIFKSYDIRGVFGDSLTLEDAYKIGYSFSQFVELSRPSYVFGFTAGP